MISKKKAVNLAVTYNGYMEALTEFCGNSCADTAQSLLIWAGMLDTLQDALQITLTDKQQLLCAMTLAENFTQ